MIPGTNTETQKDPPEKAEGGLRKKSLKAAGISFFIADMALMSSGFMAGKYEEASAGIFGLGAGYVGARYGNPKAEKQLDQVYRHLGDYLRKQDIIIPKDINAKSLSKEGGIIDHIESFLYANPSQVMNVLYSLIGVQLLRSGLKQNVNGLKFSGTFMIAGALGGLLIHEKKADPEHPPVGTFQKTVSWIQEKPLRLTGTFFTINQFFLGADALRERRLDPAQKSYMLKLLAVAGFTFGNIMMGISSKSHGGGNKMDENTLKELAETSGLIIAAQPPEVQKSLLEHISGYLASQPYVHLKANEISSMLSAKLSEVRNTIPAPATGWQAQVTSEKLTASQPSL